MSIEKVAVIGSGFMGHQIALRNAVKGYQVYLYDIEEDQSQEETG